MIAVAGHLQWVWTNVKMLATMMALIELTTERIVAAPAP